MLERPVVRRRQVPRKAYLDGFQISFDNWHSTHSPENSAISQVIYTDLKTAGLIESRTRERFYGLQKMSLQRPSKKRH